MTNQLIEEKIGEVFNIFGVSYLDEQANEIKRI